MSCQLALGFFLKVCALVFQNRFIDRRGIVKRSLKENQMSISPNGTIRWNTFPEYFWSILDNNSDYFLLTFTFVALLSINSYTRNDIEMIVTESLYWRCKSPGLFCTFSRNIFAKAFLKLKY